MPFLIWCLKSVHKNYNFRVVKEKTYEKLNGPLNENQGFKIELVIKRGSNRTRVGGRKPDRSGGKSLARGQDVYLTVNVISLSISPSL